MKYKNIIFDVDGTLINTRDSVRNSLKKTYRKFMKKEISPNDLEKSFGQPTYVTVAKLELEEKEKIRFGEAWKKAYKIESENNSIFPGAKEAIEKLINKEYKLGIVTSRRRDENKKDQFIQSIIHNFTAVICVDDTTEAKPSAQPLLKCMDLLNANKEETIYIGDSSFDKLSAKNAGVKFALALWGAENDKLESDYKLKDFNDLLEILGE